MKQEYLERLKGLYPNLYLNLVSIDCRDGWYPLIERLSAKLEAELIALPKVFRDYHAAQVKQKFGTLRFYMYRYPSDEFKQHIVDAEEESATICEFCGASAVLHSSGRWEVICDLCALKRAARYGQVRNRLEALIKYKTHLSEEEWEQLMKETGQHDSKTRF